MNQKNSLGLDNCFLDLADPFELFEKWYDAAKKKELNDPNALALATCKNNIPSVRMVLLKNFNKDGFVFYTNLNSQKSNEIKENSNVSMCFHWKSLLRQIRITGSAKQVNDEIADKYYNSRSYESRIGAWASKQSSVLNNREELLSSIQKFKNQFKDNENVPRPKHWSGWILKPINIEFWLDGENRIHERLKYELSYNGSWKKSLISP
ncbi:MAG: pyridoxamine 5'-phosphate oxidase [Pelagibacteraceae bacterium]|nr:pyridoxamine 5'-phosphate oxidase [Pelagibacteraceae bacterium]PHX88758.1 MAG: pyridoxamine 5'-phosphate oxidase [Pelagibacteraceae bacterium]